MWDRILKHVAKNIRINSEHKESSSYAIIDSQSVKIALLGEDRGIYGGEKTKERKRHIVVDTLGCILSVDVHAANIHDTKSCISTTSEAYTNYPTIQKFCANAGYRGTFVFDMREKLDLDIETSKKSNFIIGKNFLGVGLSNVLLLGSIISGTLQRL